jgi:hypothetical protein
MGGLDPQELYIHMTQESFEEIKISPEVPNYEGSGLTSFNSDHDGQKREYLEELGLTIPEDWGREYTVNAFILVNGLIAYKRAVEDDVSRPLYYSYIMRKWLNHRIDEDGDRAKAKKNSDKKLGDYHPGSKNPTLKLRPDELLEVYNHIHDSLS